MFYCVLLMMYYVHNRLLIAALHFNENFGRKQATTLAGSERIRIVFPKQKQGEFTPKPIPVPKTFSKYIASYISIKELINFNEHIL